MATGRSFVRSGGRFRAAESAAARRRATGEPSAAFADIAGEDLALARLCEGHADAAAILAALGGPPSERGSRWGVRAVRMRTLTEAVATDVIGRTGRALGAGPLGHDEAHSRAVADLTVYPRQHHAERDLVRIGEMVAERGDAW